MKSATRIMISTFGSLVGMIGIEHGVGEILQGNAASGGIMILSWPKSDFFSVLGGEPALTILPNLLVTGVLAVAFSLLYLIWAFYYVERKHGGLILILLSILMLLFGGGVFPPILGIVVGTAATRINTPLTWWQMHLSAGSQRLLTILWPWLFTACLMAWLAMFPGLAMLGYFFGVNDTNLILLLLACMFGFLILAGIAGFARDLQSKAGVPAG